MEKDYRKVSKNNGLIRKEKDQAGYKMYKARKVWLFAGMFLLTSVAMGTSVAHADTAANAANQTTVSAAAPTTSGDSTADSTSTAATTTSTTPADTSTSGTTASDTSSSSANTANTDSSNSATVTKTTSTESKPNVSIAPTITNGDTSTNQASESGDASNPDTSGAVLKGAIGGKTSTAENSTTSNVGHVDSTGEVKAVTDANDQTDRQAGDYGQTGVSDSANDNLDEFSGEDSNGEVTDITNDQGAVSSDAKAPQTRGTVIYVNGVNNVISLSLAGSNDHGVSIGVPSNLTNVAIGTFDVTDVSSVGITIKDEATGEQYQITDPSLANKYTVGSKINDMAVINSNFNGSGMQYITEPVTKAIQAVSSFMAGAGSTVLSALQTAVTNLQKGADVGAKLMPGTDMSAFDDAVQTYLDGIQTAQSNIAQSNDYGDQLMKDGVSETSLVPVTKKDDGSYEAISSESVSSAIANMVNSYVTGWTAGISDSILSALGAEPDENGDTAIDKIVKTLGDNFTINATASLADSALEKAHDVIYNGIKDSTAAVSGTIASAVQTAIDGGIGVSQTAMVPVTFTDPDLSQNTPGAFTGETFKTISKLYNATTTSDTTIVYQNVNKSQLA